MTRRVCVVTGSRAEYGILKPVMRAIQRELELRVIATGMHLLPALGNTIDEIERDGFTVDAQVSTIVAGDDQPAMAKSIGLGVISLTDAFRSLRPDVVLVLGDRTEAFAAAIAAAFSGIALAHVHGGDSPQAGLDEYARHAITKLANLHFAATATSAERIRRMGEDPSLVWVTGAPGLDTILHEPLPPTAELRARYGLQDEIGFVLFVMHPVSTDPGGASAEVRHALEGTLALGLPVIAIAPNSDAGGEAMRSALQQHESLMLYPSLPHRDFLGLLRDASALVGNSSSGIIESPSFRTPVVNVGPRQAGRERAVNVIDVDPDRDAVRKGLLHVLNDPAYREGLAHIENPYGDGRAAERIAQILATVEIDAKLRRKKLTY